MKKGIITLVLMSLLASVSAKDEANYFKLFQVEYPKPVQNTTILLKYVSRNSRTQDFAYTMRVPMNSNSLTFLANHKPKPRMVNSKFFTPRSLNLNNSDIQYIIEKNKLYHFTKENFGVKSY